MRKTYKTIAQHYPNENIVKNEFISQKVKELLGTIKSVVFNEFRIGKAIATSELKGYFNRQHYPGLGVAKKISIKNHLLIIEAFLNQR